MAGKKLYQPDTISVVCNKCHIVSQHSVKSRLMDTETDEYQEIQEYQIIQCNGCLNISFRVLTFVPAYNKYKNDEDNEGPIRVNLFPIRPRRLPKIEKWLPSKLKSIYKATLDCINDSNPLLAAAGIRTIIEGICSDKGILHGMVPDRDSNGNQKKGSDGELKFRKSNTHEGKIEGLFKEGYITSIHKERLHQLRFLGNEALHDLNAPSIKEIDLAMDIVEHTLENIYMIEKKANTLTLAQQKRNGNKTSNA